MQIFIDRDGFIDLFDSTVYVGFVFLVNLTFHSVLGLLFFLPLHQTYLPKIADLQALGGL